MIILVNAAFVPSSAVLERQFIEVLWLSGNSFTILPGLVDDSDQWNIVLQQIRAGKSFELFFQSVEYCFAADKG